MAKVTGALSGAAGGALIGSQILPGWGTAIGGLAGGLLGLFGGGEQEEAAAAEQAMAQAQLEEAQRTRQMAFGIAGPSSSDLFAQSQYLNLSQQILGRTGRELENLSKNLAVSTQGQSLEGEGLFSNLIARTRAADRSRLVQSLRARFGSGAETSSVGMEALGRFDQQTVDIGIKAIPTFLETAQQSLGNITNLENVLKSRQVNAILGTPTTQYMGADQIGRLREAQANQQNIKGLLETAGAFAPTLGSLLKEKKSPSSDTDGGGTKNFFYVGGQETGSSGIGGGFLPRIRTGPGTSFPAFGGE